MRRLYLPEVDLSKLTTIIQKDATSYLVTHGKGASHVGTMKKTLECSKL